MTPVSKSHNHHSEARPLSGNVAIVTGASRGIGRAIAIALAEAGSNIIVNYNHDTAGAQETLLHCLTTGTEAKAVQADVSDEEQVTNLILEATELGSPSILVNNAGIASDRLLIDTTLTEWNEMMATNVTGPFLCTKTVLPYLLRTGWGRIINMSSIWGISGAAGESTYSATKGALIAWTKSLARELAAASITVNAIAPGAIETDMLNSLSPMDRATLISEIPAGRIGEPADVAHLAVFLATRQADYLTGQVISMNGGILT